MLRAVIIDDETRSRSTLLNLLKKYCDNITVVSEANSVKTGLRTISQFKPDVVFLDIQLSDGTGFDILEQLQIIDFRIIFVTAYNQYALRAFKFSTVDYLLKPIDPDQLIDAVEQLKVDFTYESINKKLEVLIGNRNSFEKIALPCIDGIRFESIKDIVRCESESNYTIIHLNTEESIMVTRTLKEYEEMLSSLNFFRVHQSHLINMGYVKKYVKGEGGSVIMEDGTEVEVARRRKEGFLTALLSS